LNGSSFKKLTSISLPETSEECMLDPFLIISLLQLFFRGEA